MCQGSLLLLRISDAGRRFDHGSHRTVVQGRKDDQEQCCSSLQGMQFKEEKPASHGVGRSVLLTDYRKLQNQDTRVICRFPAAPGSEATIHVLMVS
jgi:hypothetical protein